jgi:hypothetical protein
MGWRTTATNLNLNRDFLKADSPEMRFWLRLYQQWNPDFIVDIHVTDGADYQYVVTYDFMTHGGMDKGLTDWTNNRFIPEMETFMDQAGYPAFPYVMFRRWHDPRSGLRRSAASPRLSFGYAGVQNRIGLLVENHSLKDYKTRVSGTYELLKFLCSFLDENASELKELNISADNYVATEAFRNEPLPVRFKNGPDSIMIDFRGVEYDVLQSDLTGGDWFIYHPDKPATFKVPFFYKQIPETFVDIPEAYIIPPEWEEIITRLSMHGVNFDVLLEPALVEVETYKFTNIEYAGSSFEGRTQVSPTFEKYIEKKEFPTGSIIVPTNQRTARVIAHILEPASPDSYLQWGFFNATFERKEYFETYVMEVKAREMIEENPSLLEEFDKWKEDNPEMARNQWLQLEWFYNRSSWADDRRYVYPVGRIMDQETLKMLSN